MSIVKIIELSGSSPIGWEDAAKNAVRAASVTVKDMVCVDVLGWTGQIGPDGEISEYRANVKIAFKVRLAED